MTLDCTCIGRVKREDGWYAAYHWDQHLSVLPVAMIIIRTYGRFEAILV